MLDIVSPAGIVKPDDERHTDGNARGWKFFVDTINSIWRKGAGDFIACGRYLIEAKDELARDAYSAMLTKLHFNTSTAKKLICIAKNTTLGSHVNLLPPCWSTLYELSQLKEDVLKAALDSGSVHPGMQRKDATALKPKSNNKSTSSSEVQSPDLSTTWNAASADQRREFLDELGRDGLCSRRGGRFRGPPGQPLGLADLRPRRTTHVPRSHDLEPGSCADVETRVVVPNG